MVSTVSQASAAASESSSAQRSSLRYLAEVNDQTSPNQSLLPWSAAVNDKDHLTVGGCDVVDLIKEFGSPLYILDEHTLRTAARQYKQAFENHYAGESLIVYASKAWNCLAVCAIATQEGIAIDVVSGGELQTAISAGAKGEMLYFHGNNKSTEELSLGLNADARIVVDNWHELKTLNQLAGETGKRATILLRLTPGIECHTHEYIKTGHIDSKFGFDPDQLEEVFAYISKQTQYVNCVGLHAHIGSQIFELQPHRDLAEVMTKWFQTASSYGISIQEIDFGGGLCFLFTESDDPPSIDEWDTTVIEFILTAFPSKDIPLPYILL